MFRTTGLDVLSVKREKSGMSNETGNGFVSAVGRIIHVVPEHMPEVCHVAIITGMEHLPPTLYVRVWDRFGLAEWPESLRTDLSTDRVRFHDPRSCPRHNAQPASRDAE